MKHIKWILTTAIAVSLIGCVTSDEYEKPNLSSECINMTTTKQVAEIAALAQPNTPILYTDNDVIEAYVTSSDEGGNFYKSISLVSTDGEKGFTIPADDYNLYTKFEPGRKVYIKLQNQYYSFTNQTHSFEIGNLYNGTQIGRLSGIDYKNVILSSCEKVSEESLVHRISIAEAKNDSYLHKLIEFDNVQFADASIEHNYFDEALSYAGASATDHQIVDGDGNSLIVRNSKYAVFAGDKIPSGSGKIRGVMTKYGSNYQFMLRTTNDVQLTNNRLDFSFLSSVNETFSDYANNDSSFSRYYNMATAGTYLWQVKTFSGNKYIQMTAYNSGGANKALFIIPVNFDAVSSMSFKTIDGYYNGNALKVYYSFDLNPQSPASATLTDITSNFAISSGHTSGYAPSFTNSGVYNFPSLSGNGYIVFEYTGSASGVTTTMQLDDIVIN